MPSEKTQQPYSENAANTVSARLLALRQKSGLTRTQLAARVGIGDAGLRYLETTRTGTPSFEVGLRLADELKVSPWYLLTGQGAGETPVPVADPTKTVVLPEVTVAQVASLIAQLHEVASEMRQGAGALAEVAESRSHEQQAAPQHGNSRSRKRAS